MKNAPIGVFDSGVGGLSVLREIRALLPGEDLLYVADSGHAPYGHRAAEYILQRAEAITDFFITQGAKAVVVACNTATAAAVQILRSKYSLTIVAMEPALKPAAENTRSGIIAILATNGTLGSDNFARLAGKYSKSAQVLLQACPGFVELVEKAQLNEPDTIAQVEHYVSPLLTQGADTLVLGCTHYPFLSPVIQSICGPQVSIIDPSPAVARQLHRRLMELELLCTERKSGTERFWTSGNPSQVKLVIARLTGKIIDVEMLPVRFSRQR
jgi:glutamate racemase